MNISYVWSVNLNFRDFEYIFIWLGQYGWKDVFTALQGI